ncbi:DUF4352 domain-containing protein [Streptococcus devriesei]|uniref:DUF4352 domain-containing protein n=1 Tax=Streptococcus devriesei TaxID=231233 RepID=UPI000418672E|nr:DUF4352 domain-containing protein [Streptococcus devriesei]
MKKSSAKHLVATMIGAGVLSMSIMLGEFTPLYPKNTDYISSAVVHAKTKKRKVYKKGQLVKVGKVEYTINSVTTSTNVGGEFGDNASGTFLILNVTITNKGTEPLTISDDFFTLMKGKTSYSADSSAGVFANEDANFLYSELNPENSMSGNIVFDITPETASDPKLMVKVQTGIWGTQTAKIYVNQ